MMSDDDWHAVAIPREQHDPFDYARMLFDKLRDYVDIRNSHRAKAIETIGVVAANCERDLARGESRPGWVWMMFREHRGDIDDVKLAMRSQNRKLNAILTMAIVMLLGVIGNLIALTAGAYPTHGG